MKHFFVLLLLLTFSMPGFPARTLDGTDDEITIASQIVPDVPATICAWVKPRVSPAADAGFVWQSNTSGANGSLLALYVRSADTVRATAQNSSFSGSSSTTTGTVNVGSWNIACGVWVSTSSRTAWLNGTAATTDTAAVTTGVLNQTNIGSVREAGTTSSNFFDGDVGTIWYWNTAASTAQLTSIALGWDGCFIKPVGCKRLFVTGNGTEISSAGETFSLVGTTKADHHRIFFGD
jgi:hypothetical protein